MSDEDAIDLALLVFRCGIGAVMLAHGVNHVIGGGKIAGTARWFDSLGMRAPRVQAWLASLTEVVGGILLLLGLLLPLAGAAVIGVMAVAWIANHRSNGFFIFRPGEGYEYVMVLLLCGITIGTVGGGAWSLDRALGIDDDMTGVVGLVVALLGGFGGSALQLGASWRPGRNSSDQAS